jgi:hypothetical protein
MVQILPKIARFLLARLSLALVLLWVEMESVKIFKIEKRM